MGVVVIVIFYRCRNVSLLFSSSIGKLSSFIGSCFQSFFLLQYFWFYINPSLCFLHRFVTWQFSFQLILSRFRTSVIDFTSLLNSQFFYLSIPLTESFPLSLFVTLCSYFSIYITFSLCRSFYLFISFSLCLSISLPLSVYRALFIFFTSLSAFRPLSAPVSLLLSLPSSPFLCPFPLCFWLFLSLCPSFRLCPSLFVCPYHHTCTHPPLLLSFPTVFSLFLSFSLDIFVHFPFFLLHLHVCLMVWKAMDWNYSRIGLPSAYGEEYHF